MSLVEFKNIKKGFNKREVLKNISLNVDSGEIFGLVGKSGCGKTTLLKILIGMLKVDSGKIFFEGNDAKKNLYYLRKNTGYASQENMLFDELTIRENGYYFGVMYGMKKKELHERFEELAKFLNIENYSDYQISHLSGGMIKRANLLVSLIHKPKLLILDEPTVGLDPIIRKVLWQYIHKINNDGTTILITSHLLDEIEANCDRVAILKNGEILFFAPIEEYKKMYGKDLSFNDIFEKLMGL